MTTSSLKNHVLTIKLNDPKSLNALSPDLMSSLISTIHSAQQDPQVRVIVLTGEGRFFSAGANLTSIDPTLQNMGDVVYSSLMATYFTMIKTISESKKPIIAAINGGAVGAGASISLASDLRLMADDAYLNFTFINIGLVPDAGGSYFLARQVGHGKALEIALGGKRIPASTCLSLNLTNKVVPASELLNKAQEWAEELSQKSSYALWATKSLIRNAQVSSLSEAMLYEAQLQRLAAGSPQNLEGVQAFFEKRKAEFHKAPPVVVPEGTIYSRL